MDSDDDSRPSSGCLHQIRSHWKIVFLGQSLSFLLACTGAAQATLSVRCHLSAPSFSVGLIYLCLAVFLIPTCRKNNQYYTSEIIQQEEDETIFSDPADAVHQSVLTSGEHEMFDSGREQPHIDSEDTAMNANHSRYTFLSVFSLHTPPWLYFVIAVADVYANYFTVLAFKYTSITSVTLLDALAIPSAMICSRLLLHRSYLGLHLVGVILCMIGIVFNVMQDYQDDLQQETSKTEVFPHKFRGDLFAVLGGILFGVDNTLVEYAVRDLGGPWEYLGMLGLFASILCAIQSVAFERKEISEFWTGNTDSNGDTCDTFTSGWLLLVFSVGNAAGYVGGSLFLQISDAAFFNLSLLTGDMWSVLFSVIEQHIVPHPFFYLALVTTVAGVIVYEMAPSPVQGHRKADQPGVRSRIVDSSEVELHLQLEDRIIT